MTYPTISPELTLDFAKSEQLDPRITFSRSSSATYVGSDGLIKTAPDGVARFEYDSDGKCLGLLIEEARTNSLEWSEDVSNAYWTQQECSLGATTTAPDGTNSAYLVIPSTTDTNLHRLRISTGALNQQRSQSCYAKAGGYNYVFFRSQNTDVVFDLSTGLANNPNGEMIPIGNGWYRCIYTGSAFLGSRISFGVSPLSDGTGAGNGTDGVYLWGLQWEDLATFPTSYIPTAGSTATRAADLASIAGTNFSSWYNTSEGTIILRTPKTLPSAGNRYYYAIGPSGSERIATWQPNNFSFRVSIQSSGATFTGQIANPDEPIKSALSFNGSGASWAVNGSIVNTSTTITPPATAAQLSFSTRSTGAVVQDPITKFHLTGFVYYDRRVSDAELQSLTS